MLVYWEVSLRNGISPFRHLRALRSSEVLIRMTNTNEEVSRPARTAHYLCLSRSGRSERQSLSRFSRHGSSLFPGKSSGVAARRDIRDFVIASFAFLFRLWWGCLICRSHDPVFLVLQRPIMIFNTTVFGS